MPEPQSKESCRFTRANVKGITLHRTVMLLSRVPHLLRTLTEVSER
jgi:hypothetical protein